MKRRILQSQALLDPQTRKLNSDDEAAAYSLAKVASGIYVERVLRPSGGSYVRQAARFQEEESFTSWLDSDQLQFVHPLLFAQIKRAAHELFNQRPEPRQDAPTGPLSARVLL